MRIPLLLLALVLATLSPLFLTTGHAAHVSLPPLPGNLIVPGNSGVYEWVWIAPCAPPDGDECSLKHGVEGYGFSAPTSVAQWTESFTGYTDIFNSFTDFTTRPFATPLCAASFFSQEHTECSPGDLAAGAIWRSPFAPPVFADFRTSIAAESLWVRTATVVDPNVPEGSTVWMMVLGLLTIGLVQYRYRKG